MHVDRTGSEKDDGLEAGKFPRIDTIDSNRMEQLLKISDVAGFDFAAG